MGLAEDQQKVRRIVQGSWDPLLQMYSPFLEVGVLEKVQCAM